MLALVSRQRDFNQVTTVDASAGVQIAFVVLSFLTASYIFLKSRLHREILLHTPLKWFIIFIFWAAMTSLWSVQFSLTAYRAFENLAYLLLITAVISKLSRKIGVYRLIDWVVKYSVFTIIVSLFRRFIQFDMSLFSLSTILSEQMNSTPFFFLALMLPVGWIAKTVILPISIFSTSNTAYAGFAAGLVAFGKGNNWLKGIFLILSISTLFLIYIYGSENILQQTIFYGKEGVGLEYTTGRADFFKLAYNEAMEKLWSGYGFVAGETFIITKVRNAVIGAHNGILSALLGTGIIGALFFIVFLARMLWISKSNNFPPILRGVFFATTILILIHTMGNPGLGTRVYGTWIPAVLIFSMISTFHLHFKKNIDYENNMGYS